MNSAMIKDLIKTISPKFDKYYAGKLDNKYKKSICVYSLKGQNSKVIAIGGIPNTKTKSKSFSILIHWTDNYTETEIISELLYESISNIKQHIISNNEKQYNINYIEMLNDASINLYTDESGVYERLIDIKVYYNEK